MFVVWEPMLDTPSNNDDTQKENKMMYTWYVLRGTKNKSETMTTIQLTKPKEWTRRQRQNEWREKLYRTVRACVRTHRALKRHGIRCIVWCVRYKIDESNNHRVIRRWQNQQNFHCDKITWHKRQPRTKTIKKTNTNNNEPESWEREKKNA